MEGSPKSDTSLIIKYSKEKLVRYPPLTLKIMSLKFSKYNYYRSGEQIDIVFNVLSGKYVALTKETENILFRCLDNIDLLKYSHYELFKVLVENGMIVCSEINETELCVKYLKNRYKNNGTLSITINPTMNCNVNCWYCYEKHIADSRMEYDIILGLQNLIKNKVEIENISKIYLSFFGGEPLLQFNDCVLPLVKFAYNYSQKRNLEFSISFTTNGICLDKHTVDTLAGFNIPISIQVPFDGNQHFHNKVKKGVINTYQTTLTNVKYALSKGIDVTVRCNYTNQSIDSFYDLIMDFKNEIQLHSNNLNFMFQKIWQVKESIDTKSCVEYLENVIKNLNGRYYDVSLDITTCYADYYNSFVVHYNGDIYQCTARDFTEETKEGVLDSNGFIIYNDRYYKRMKSLYENKVCKECISWPICGACSQKRLENSKDCCVLHLREDERYIKVKRVVDAILDKVLHQYNI